MLLPISDPARHAAESVTGVRKYGHDLAEEDPHFLGGFAEYCYILPGTGILKLPDELS